MTADEFITELFQYTDPDYEVVVATGTTQTPIAYIHRNDADRTFVITMEIVDTPHHAPATPTTDENGRVLRNIQIERNIPRYKITRRNPRTSPNADAEQNIPRRAIIRRKITRPPTPE